MLQTWFVTKMLERGLEATADLQQDGAPALYALPDREYLEDKFSALWIARGSDMVWPPRNPDFTTRDSSLWGTVKEKISQLRLTTVEGLKAASSESFNDSQSKRESRRRWGKN
jgi:hypothetical protein